MRGYCQRYVDVCGCMEGVHGKFVTRAYISKWCYPSDKQATRNHLKPRFYTQRLNNKKPSIFFLIVVMDFNFDFKLLLDKQGRPELSGLSNIQAWYRPVTRFRRLSNKKIYTRVQFIITQIFSGKFVVPLLPELGPVALQVTEGFLFY